MLSIAALSEMSIQRGGAPVDVPDFTNGKWYRREPGNMTKYSLDEIVEDPDTPIFKTIFQPVFRMYRDLSLAGAKIANEFQFGTLVLIRKIYNT